MTPTPDLAILRHLVDRTHASAAEIGIACRFTAAEVRSHLVILDLMGLVSGRYDPCSRPPRRIYVATGEGRKKAEAAGARA